PSLAYLAYLLLDRAVIPQSRSIKWLRNSSPVLFVLMCAPALLRELGAPAVGAPGALLALLAGALFPYIYEPPRAGLAVLRGLLLARALEGGAQCLWPTASGAPAALPLFAGVFALAARTVFWRYAAVVLLAYAIAVPAWLGWTPGLALHLLAGLVAAAVA